MSMTHGQAADIASGVQRMAASFERMAEAFQRMAAAAEHRNAVTIGAPEEEST